MERIHRLLVFGFVVFTIKGVGCHSYFMAILCFAGFGEEFWQKMTGINTTQMV